MAESVRDIALSENDDGSVTVHKADCPDVRKLAEQGRPVATLLGIQGPVPREIPWHSCLDDAK